MTGKTIMNLQVEAVEPVMPDMVFVRLRNVSSDPLADCRPGQFVELGLAAPGVLLNRPYSIFGASDTNLYLLVKKVGKGSEALAAAAAGTPVTAVGPLGGSFSLSASMPLLVGGGVGIAPMVFLAREYAARGVRPVVILGQRSKPDPFLYECFEDVADLVVCTDDGSAGWHGVVTSCPEFNPGAFDIVQTCGPTPMMKAVGAAAAAAGVRCEVSLENRMACGLGACLCCVQDMADGARKCVCTEGPVFNYKEVKW